MKLSILLLCVFINSCSLFKSAEKLKSTNSAFKNVCLDAEGAGRIFVNSQTYVFNYESALFRDDLKFSVLMNFPLYGQEKFEMVWDIDKSSSSYAASYENMILENANNIDIKVFNRLSYAWKQFFEDFLKGNQLIKGKVSDWTILKAKELIKEFKFKNDLVRMHFSNQTSQNYFGKFTMNYYKNTDKYFGLEFIVRKCM